MAILGNRIEAMEATDAVSCDICPENIQEGERYLMEELNDAVITAHVECIANLIVQHREQRKSFAN